MPKSTFFNLPETKRRRIIDAALEEFSSKNYDQVSVSSVADAAGIAKGSIYQYFDDKLDLYRYLLDCAIGEKLAYFSDGVTLGGEDLFEDLEVLTAAGARFARDRPRYHELAARFAESPVRERILPDLKDQSAAFLRHMVDRAHDLGRIRGDVSPKLALYFLNTLLSEFGTYLLREYAADWNRVGSEDACDPVMREVGELMRLIRFGLAPTGEVPEDD